MLQLHPILPQHDRNINEIEQLSSEWTNQIVQASLSAILITNKRIIPHIKPNNIEKPTSLTHCPATINTKFWPFIRKTRNIKFT